MTTPSPWHMITLVGVDRPGIVARVSGALYDLGCNLGETSMLRLGGNFTIMMMVGGPPGEETLRAALAPVAAELGLRLHIDNVDGALHRHLIPDVQVTVFGADRTGIVARVTAELAAAGINILDLGSDVAGSAEKPVYVLIIEGLAEGGTDIEALRQRLAPLDAEGIEVEVHPIDTLIG